MIERDGSGRQSLGATPDHWSWRGPLQLSWDGRQLLHTRTGRVYDTATGQYFPLRVSMLAAGSIIYDYSLPTVMDASGRQFVYITRNENSNADSGRMVAAELDPAALGSAPNVTNTSVAPAAVRADGTTRATVNAGISSPLTLAGADAAVLNKGIDDVFIQHQPLSSAGSGSYRTDQLRVANLSAQ